jgi:serine/threonine protein phosphatase 1
MAGPASTHRQVFAIGDVHGRADLLSALLTEIEKSAQANALVIFLGDYIDRGPESIRALKIALDGLSRLSSIALPGNHEQFLVSFLTMEGTEQFDVFDVWCGWNGGDAVMTELGFPPSIVSTALIPPFLAALRTALGPDRISKLLSLPSHTFVDGYLFVHGGIHPSRPMQEFLARPWHHIEFWNEDADPLWIRGPFLTHEGLFEGGYVVVHGHTPFDEPEILPNRINCDTGAYRSGRLTAVELDGGGMRIIQAIGGRGRG